GMAVVAFLAILVLLWPVPAGAIDSCFVLFRVVNIRDISTPRNVVRMTPMTPRQIWALGGAPAMRCAWRNSKMRPETDVFVLLLPCRMRDLTILLVHLITTVSRIRSL